MDDHLLSRITGSDPITRRQALFRVAHLVGGALSATMLGGLAGRALASPAPALAAPLRETLTAVVDHIIPQTDTPGARAVGVPEFVEVIWQECFTAEQQQAFLAGLSELDARAAAAYDRPFSACTGEEQHLLLVALDAESFAPSPAAPEDPALTQAPRRAEKVPGTAPAAAGDEITWRWGEPGRSTGLLPFWRTLKRLTLVGYYTSEVGATEELRYEALPGRYDGCVPLAEIGRTWAI